MPQEICTHCTSPITHTRIESPMGIFCCHACQTVAELLQMESLDEQYKHLLSLAGKSPKKLNTNHGVLSQKLQNQDFLQSVGSWTDSIHQIELVSEEIQCAACAWLLEKALGQEKGIQMIRVNFPKARMEIRYESKQITLLDIITKAKKFGYSLNLQEYKANSSQEKMEKALLYRMSVAAFAFMNVMTFTFSAYLEQLSTLRDWSSLMNLWAMILTLPVIFYSATPFYQKAWTGLKNGIIHMDLPVSLGIIFSFLASILLWWQGMVTYFDTASGVVFFLLLGRWWVTRFERDLINQGDWLGELIPSRILRQEAEGLKPISPNELQVQDLFRLNNQEVLPVASVLKDEQADFDPQWITGESRLQRFFQGQRVPAGYLSQMECTLEVQEKFSDSAFRQMTQKWHENMQEATQNRAEKLVPYFTLIIILLALIAGYCALPNWILVFEQAALILILSCPCALALSRPLSEGFALNYARKLGFLVRNPHNLEDLKQIDTIVLDKTGTLTQHQRSIKNWQWLDESPLHRELIALCASLSLHPASRALASELAQTSLDLKLIAHNEIEHLGICAQIAYQNQHFEVWIRRSWIKTEDQIQLNLDLDPTTLGQWDSMVLINQKIVALMEFSDQILPGAELMIQNLKAQGKIIHLLSGDKPQRVEKLARQLGIPHWHGGQSPFQKEALMLNLKAQGKKILGAGDGFNDALMLNCAHLSALAYGGAKSLGTQAQFLALRGDWTGFAALFNLPQTRLLSEWSGYTLSLIYNAITLYLAFAGYLAPLVGAIAMPLSSLSVALATWMVFVIFQNPRTSK